MKTNNSIGEAQECKVWLVAKMEDVKFIYENGSGDEDDILACWRIVCDAGHRAATLGWPDLAEEARTYDEFDDFLSVNVFLSKCLKRCQDHAMNCGESSPTEQDGTVASSPDDAADGDKPEEPPDLPTRFKTAYQSFMVAANEIGREVTDKEAYDWIELHLSDKYDDLPDFKTWGRYLS